MKRTAMRRVSAKKAKRAASAEGKADALYLDAVRALPCVCCGVMGVDPHHCRDTPDFDERGLYDRIPGARMRSADRDAVPLCPPHHRMFHLERAAFHAKYGKDYRFIAQTRAAVSDMEFDL